MDQTTPAFQPMPPDPNAGKGLGIAGLIVGIIALLFSFIPCLGMYAIVPAVVGIILSAISMAQASKAAQPKGMAIGGLICSTIAVAIAIYWIYVTYYVVQNSDAMLKITEEFNKEGVMDSLNKAMEQLKDITDSSQNQ